MGTVMFVSLFGIELLMQIGMMKYLRPVGRPVARLANLPSESAVTFLVGIGSMIAAHTMAAEFYTDKKLNRQELLATGVLNTVPFHIKETLTFQIPIVLPLLGPRLCLIYIAAFWTAALIKIFFVVGYGRIVIKPQLQRPDAFDSLTCNPDEEDCTPRTFKQLLADTWNARKKMFFRMVRLLALVTLIIQLLLTSGLLQAVESLIAPLTSLLDLPAAVIGPITAYIFSPTVGITYMSNLLNGNAVTPFQAIVALLAGGIIMIPVMRLRRTIPRYIAIYGVKNGAAIAGLTTALSISSRIVMLALVLIFWKPAGI